MQLEKEDLAAYVRLAADKRVREAGGRQLADIRVAKDPAGILVAALKLVPLGSGTFVLAGPFGSEADAAGLVAEAMARARAQAARGISTRPDTDRVGPLYRAALLAHGFEDLGERIEFEAPVDGLPLDGGTPLTWREVGGDRAAEVLREVAAGDPHGRSEREDPRAEIAGWLGAPRLTSAPRCVQVGFLGDRAAAFVCAQVSPRDGWSRIAYMGLVPDLRGRGLGAWVHRRGFRILKELGGKRYHGGTAASNAAMLRLFRKHGCEESRRMLEFEWRAPAADKTRT